MIGNAVHVMRVLTGEIEDTIPDDGKDPAAVALGRKGGKARAEGMSAKRRKEIARQAAKERWKKV
ncbi:MAG: RNA-binding protein [Methylocella sp.]